MRFAEIFGSSLFMVERLIVILLILLCLLLGVCFILAPWTRVLGNWNDNFFLVFLTEKLGLTFLQSVVGSNWFRGGVTGLGVLNLLIAFWELANFNRSVAILKAENVKTVGENK